MLQVSATSAQDNDMGNYSRICGRTRPNEKFSGKGHRTHVCKDCAQLPKENRDAIEQREEIFNYLKQSHISAKNTARLQRLAASSNQEVAELAAIVIEIAKVKPYKRRRLKVLARQRRDLLDALERTGLIFAHHG
jgi:ribosome-binding protein aMBF1 (putative translation factor)